MTKFINDPRIDDYAEAHTTPPPDFMRALAEETRATLESSVMLTGVVEGRLLEMLVHALQPRRVLEIGTYSGHSALSMAAALPDGAKIVTCELDPERVAFAQRHIDASPYADRIEIRQGPALDTIAKLDGSFDLIFIDADKPNYPAYYEAAVDLVSPTGLIVLDNTLWSGRVLEGEDDGSEATQVFRELNERIATDERVVAVVLPVRDGVTLVRPA